jgi:GTPase SAR1 family protein
VKEKEKRRERSRPNQDGGTDPKTTRDNSSNREHKAIASLLRLKAEGPPKSPRDHIFLKDYYASERNMFSLATGLYQSYFAPPKLSILVIGLDGSGKTALLERIKVTNFSPKDISTIGQSDDKCVVGAVVGSNLDEDTLKRGARPARLPPPLPPKKAAESRKNVDEALAAEERQNGVTNNEHKLKEREALLQGIPPPPLCGLDVSESSNGTGGPIDTTKSNPSVTQASRPPLPPKPGLPNSITPNSTPTPIATPSKQSSFLQLLRCPSPQRYSSSALGEEDDEIYQDAIHASALSAICTSAQKKSLVQQHEEWNTDYLKDYYINYSEEEEFDVKVVNGKKCKMFPLERIRPTLGQNLAKVDVCGCKCSLFDLSGAEKMRPLWERYYRDTDAIVYVVNSSDSSFTNLQQSRNEFVKLCQNDVLKRRLDRGLPIMIFANMLDLAYCEYDKGVEKSNEMDRRMHVSWNADEEDAFVGGTRQRDTKRNGEEEDSVSNRALSFTDLLRLFDVTASSQPTDSVAQCSNGNSDYNNILVGRSAHTKGNVFLFGGSAKSGEGVKSGMEYLVVQSKKYHLAVNNSQ